MNIAKISVSPNPTQLGAELVIFPNNPPSHPTYQKSSFQAQDDLYLKGKVVSLNTLNS